MDFLSAVSNVNPLSAGLSGLPAAPGLSSLGGALNRLTSANAPGVQDPTVAALLAQQEVTSTVLTTLLALLTQLLANGAANNGLASGSSAAPVTGISGGSPVSGGSGGAAPVSGGGSGGGVSSVPSVNTPGTPGQNGFINPIDGDLNVSSEFGGRKSPTTGAPDNHGGIDIPKPAGTPIRAAKSGTVSVSKSDSGGYGNWVEIKHEDGSSTRYAHMSQRGVQQGARVEQGQTIGTVGSTGNSTGNHLHFEYRNAQGQAVDPRQILKL
jgi:murein DD-endopeptidase MepM/ murein hydrolase activator NlpD